MWIFLCIVHFWKHCFQYHTIQWNLCSSAPLLLPKMPLWSVYHSVHLTIKYGTFLFPLFVIDIGLQQPDAKTANRWTVVSLSAFPCDRSDRLLCCSALMTAKRQCPYWWLWFPFISMFGSVSLSAWYKPRLLVPWCTMCNMMPMRCLIRGSALNMWINVS